MLPNDKFGRTVTMVTQNGQDVYTADDGHGHTIQVSFPTGTDQAKAYNSLNSQAPPGYIPPTPKLSDTLDNKAFGQYVIDQFSNTNSSRNLTPDQNLQIAETLAPFFILAQAGSIQTLAAEISKIPVDGVMITQDVIDQFSALIQGYLSGAI